MLNSNLPVPKFSIGQKVWFATTHRETSSYPCPDCNNTRQWMARTAAGEFIPVHCPRCMQYGISNIETPEELAEQIADWAGVYVSPPDGDHPDDCKCRMCFIEMVERRIWQAVENGARLGVYIPES